MPMYQVTKTPGGGYWIRQGDAVDAGVAAVGSAAGTALGLGINAVRRSRMKADLSRHNSAIDALEQAMARNDWDQLGELATEFMRRYPYEEGGYIALAGALMNHERLSPQIKLDGAATIAAHTTDQTYASLVRCSAYEDLEDMPRLLQEANQVIAYGAPDLRDVGLRFRSKALLWLGDLDHAMADANAALALAPRASLYAMRGDILWARGELDNAISEYSLAVRLDAEFPKWLDRRASALEAAGRSDDAAADAKLSQHIRFWEATHETPYSGASVWNTPDASAPPVTALPPGTPIRVVEVFGAWARVDARNTWTGWVDHRILRSLSS